MCSLKSVLTWSWQKLVGFSYFAFDLNFHNTLEDEINPLLRKATQAFASLDARVWFQRSLSFKPKLAGYNIWVISKLIYFYEIKQCERVVMVKGFKRENVRRSISGWVRFIHIRAYGLFLLIRKHLAFVDRQSVLLPAEFYKIFPLKKFYRTKCISLVR